MKTPILALCLALFATPGPGHPEFVPVAERSVEKTFESSLEAELVRQVMYEISEEGEVGFDNPEMEETVYRTSTHIRWTDEYKAVDGERVTSLRRTFLKAEREFATEVASGEGETGERTSRLTGHAIDFVWDADSEQYDAEWVPNDDAPSPEDSLLEDHSVMVEYHRLLPREAVEEGDSWEVDPRTYYWLTQPGARVDIQVPRSEEGFAIWVESMEQHKENMTGEITCTWESTEEGRATIVLEGRVTVVTEQVEVDSEDPGQRVVFRNTNSYPADGELVWDLELNRAVSFFIEGKMVDRRDTIQEEGGEPRFKWSSFYEGTLREESRFE